MFSFFKCKHPAKSLVVEQKETVEHVNADFNVHTCHLKCGKCGEKIEIKYSSLVETVESYLLGRGLTQPMFTVEQSAFVEDAFDYLERRKQLSKGDGDPDPNGPWKESD